MGFAGRLAIVGLLLIFGPGVHGQGQILLLDRSGSMQSYYQSGLIRELGQRLNGLMQVSQTNPVAIGAFNSNIEIFLDVNRIVPTGSTYLDVAVDYAIANHYSIAWLVTDNIMHRSGEEKGKTREFYDRLKTDAVLRVVIFPLKQEEGKGHPGIIVYALLLSQDRSDAFKHQTEEFARLTPNTTLLPMKPLDRETIETIFVDNPTTKNGTVYSDGAVVKESIQVRFRSKFDHLKIGDADISDPRVAPEFSKNSLLSFEKDNVRINPTKITELGPRGETVQSYNVSVDLGRIRLKRDPKSLWQAALRNPNEEINLDLSFSIKVPKERFQLSDAFLDSFNADTTEAAKNAGKIYDLRGLPLLVAENQTTINVPHKPKIRVKYPWWLVFIFPGLPIAAVALLSGAGLYVSRALRRASSKRPKWTVDVQAPSDAKGTIQHGWVTVTVDHRSNRLGQIKGAKFFPAASVTPKEPLSIKEGEPMSFTSRRKDYSLILRRATSLNAGDGRAGEERKKVGKRNQIKI